MSREAAQKVEEDRVVALEFTLTDQDGEELDRATSDAPFVYIHGHGALPPAFERAVADRRVRDRFEAELPYRELVASELDDDVRTLPIDAFEPGEVPGPGDEVTVEEDGETFPVWVVGVSPHHVWVSPTPGPDRKVSLVAEVLAVRAATPRELERGTPDGLEPAPDESE